jgi:hypothetical protein
MDQHIRIHSINDLPEIPGTGPLKFTWFVGTELNEGNKEYISKVTVADGSLVFVEHCFSCDGKYSSAGANHYDDVVRWMKEKYGKRFSGVIKEYQDYDCGCYFMD